MLLHIRAVCVTMMNMALSLAEEDNGNGPIEVSKTTYTYIANPVSHDVWDRGGMKKENSSESVPDHLCKRDRERKKRRVFRTESENSISPPPLHRKENTAQPLCNRNLRHDHRDMQAP